MQERVCRIPMTEIARLTGQKIEAVRRHRHAGWFDMKDPESVIKYTQAKMALDEISGRVQEGD